MSYYGQLPFNTNGGALLSKRNYINRKLDEIEQKLLQLGWIEPEQETITQESISDEYNLPVESAGALIPYRDKVNKRLDFFEEVIQSHTSYNNSYNNSYDNYYDNSYNSSYDSSYDSSYNNSYDNSYNYTSNKPQNYNQNYNTSVSKPQNYTQAQQEVKKQVDSVVKPILF